MRSPRYCCQWSLNCYVCLLLIIAVQALLLAKLAYTPTTCYGRGSKDSLAIRPDFEQRSIGAIPMKKVRYDPENFFARYVNRIIPDGFDNRCEQLFETRKDAYDFNTEYQRGMSAFIAHLKSIPNATDEADTSGSRIKSLFLHYLAQAPGVKTICETGFNVGYSALNYLTANPEAKVHSFDINFHPGTRPMAEYLRSLYGERIQMHYGDSREELPAFHKERPDLKCDVIFVDGGHNGSVPFSDISNFVTMFAIPHHSIMVFDDYPTDWAMSWGLVSGWESAIHLRMVAELFRCSYFPIKGELEWGFSVGLVIS